MITKMTGRLDRVLDDEVRLEVGPIEYQILVPEAVRRMIQTKVDTEISLHITEFLEGNSGGNRFVPRRIGFLTEAEVDFFDLFCTVEKIGAKKALKAMARPVAEIAEAISRQDVKWLSTLPGIGPTTAEQVVTALKRKVARFLTSASALSPEDNGKKETRAGGKSSRARADSGPEVQSGLNGKVIDEVYQALMSLGLNPAEARTKLDAMLTSGKSISSVQEGIAIAFA